MTKLFINNEEVEILDHCPFNEDQVLLEFDYSGYIKHPTWPAPDNDDECFAMTFKVTLHCSCVVDESGHYEVQVDAVVLDSVECEVPKYQGYFNARIDSLEDQLLKLAEQGEFAEDILNSVKLEEFDFDDYRN